MDASALAKAADVLRNSISAIESRVSSYETFAEWASLVVIVGCAIELFVIGWEYRDDFKAFRRESIKTPGRPSGWLLFFNVLGTVLVIAGIGGELFATLRVESLQGDLQGKNRKLTQLFEDAFSGALRESASLRKQAEGERTARIAIEDAVEWRSLTKPEQARLSDQLRPHSGQVASFAFQANDTEAEKFASDLSTALKHAGWLVPQDPLEMLRMREGPVPFGTTTILETGVLVRSTSDQRSRQAASALMGALDSRGFDAHTEGFMNSSTPAVGLFILHRPFGPQGAAKFRHSKGN